MRQILLVVTVVAFLCIGLPALANGATTSKGQYPSACLVADSHFMYGAVTYDPKEGEGHRQIGSLRGFSDVSKTVWGLSQWNTVQPFAGEVSPVQDSRDLIVYKMGSKRIMFGRKGEPFEVRMGLNSSLEYPNKLRRRNERWPALYFWQRFDKTTPISDLKVIQFKLDTKLLYLRNLHPPGTYDSKRHAAQFSVFLTIQNLNHDSPDYGRYIWFGIPIFDSRTTRLPHHEQRDAFTNKFIYEIDSSHLEPTVGGWVHLDINLIDEVRTAIEHAAEKGFLRRPSLEDFYVMALNIGWEMPGSFDAMVQFKNLDVCVS
jgi:hypothetical protein